MVSSKLLLSFEKLNKSIIEYFHKDDDSVLFEKTKVLFSEWIDSKRQLEKITKIEELLSVLKRRCFYGPTEFNALVLFRKIIRDANFDDAVEEHKTLCQDIDVDDCKNIYAQKRQLRERVADVTTITTTAQSSFPADKRNKIFQTIRDGLNHPEFLTLSRYLKIDSNLIQNITIRHHDIGTRTMVMLELYESQGRSLEPLLSAIRMMGRTDVVRKVEKI